MTQRCALPTAHGGEHLFVQTRATTRLPGECPARPSHAPLPMQTKLSPNGAPLYRIPCSCGWVGCWFASRQAESWMRHSQRTAPNAPPQETPR
jgi:hypothetical protein